MGYNQGDIVLIPYPYTNLSQTKQRPVVILSRQASNMGNYIVAKITSVIRDDQFSFPIAENDIQSELKYQSEVRTNELFTVHESLIKKKFSSFKKAPLIKLSKAVIHHIAVEEQ